MFTGTFVNITAALVGGHIPKDHVKVGSFSTSTVMAASTATSFTVPLPPL